MTSLPSIGHETGIRVIGYDFSKAQHGKDICDRKTATMKQHARGLVAVTKTDILTACDLKKALESNGGVKGCRVSIVEMPQRSSQIDTNVKIKVRFTTFVTKKVTYAFGKHLTLEKENAWYQTICRQLKFQRLR